MHALAAVPGGPKPAVTSGAPVRNCRRALAVEMMMYEGEPMWGKDAQQRVDHAAGHGRRRSANRFPKLTVRV
jgi:hypothetical protein